MSNIGHGWVTPRDDGMRARCGGPGMCAVCSREANGLGAVLAQMPEPVPASEPVDSEVSWADWFDVQYAVNRAMGDALDQAGKGKSEAWNAALVSSLIESLAERQRRYIRLPESDQRKPPE